MTLKLYYCNYDGDDGIPSDSPEETALEDALACMENLPDTDGNFLGFELPGGEIIQFMHDENRGLVLDIPDPETYESCEKIIDMPECLQIIRDLYNGKKPKEIEGLICP